MSIGDNFSFNERYEPLAAKHIAKYPDGKQQSAVMPLLDLAQRQIGEDTNTQGWLPVPAIEYVAERLGMPYMRAYEVATFYTMYNLQPVGKYHIQLCGTTPCMLRGADDVMKACNDFGVEKGKTSADGLFTLTEVECLGACCNAPMVQINDDYVEDLTYDSMTSVLQALKDGKPIPVGPQVDRQTSAPVGGASTLKELSS